MASKQYSWVVVLVLSALSVLGSAVLAGCASSVPLVISPAQAKTEMQAGAMLLDVRQPEEFAGGHIEGAVLIPLGDLSAHLGELPKDRLIIVQCQTGVRSAQGRDLLRQAGFAKVTSLEGGIQAWQAAGFPIVTKN
jgi:rhodanese-related sulfurtransferase